MSEALVLSSTTDCQPRRHAVPGGVTRRGHQRQRRCRQPLGLARGRNDGLRSDTWDARNRLTAVSGVGAHYVYDAFGRQRTNTLGSTVKSYLYDGSDVVQEQNASFGATANLLTGAGIDERFTRATIGTGAATSTYLSDALGSTVALASASGTVQTNYGYDPYGTTSTSGSANTSPYQFTGRDNDGTGLYFYRARYYNPAWGRFISEDPIRLAGGINLYAYTGNDPLNLTDPSGNCPQCLVIPLGFGLCRLAGGCQLPDLFPPATPPAAPTASPPPPDPCSSGVAMCAKPPKNAYDPNGPKAPGKPGPETGFKNPKGGDDWGPSANGRGLWVERQRWQYMGSNWTRRRSALSRWLALGCARK